MLGFGVDVGIYLGTGQVAGSIRRLGRQDDVVHAISTGVLLIAGEGASQAELVGQVAFTVLQLVAIHAGRAFVVLLVGVNSS